MTPAKAKTTRADHAAMRYEAGDLERPAGDRWVTMSNALTRAGHGLTLPEKRVVGIAVSKLDSRRPLGPGEAPSTRITAAEYADLFEVDTTTAYEQLAKAAKKIYGRTITFYDAAHVRKGKALKPTKVQMRWVGEARYQRGEGWIEIYWWPRLLPHLVGLRKQFTSYQLKQASALRSVYSWRLLELLMRFESTGVAEYTIEDFATAMDATEKQQADFGKMRTKIIEPAVRELRDKDAWVIRWQPIKAGRRVAALRFEFERDRQGRLL